MKQDPLILEIKGNSLDDGPGIRTVVFFKGCPLNCVWCHNPESKKTGPEISFDPGTCIDCGTCAGICREKALSKENAHYLDRERCSLCFACIDACPSGALSRVGSHMPVLDILEKVLPDKPFFSNSGGGVTLSGGEPTLFMDYASSLLQRFRDEGIHTLLETCGLFSFDDFHKRLLPYLDVVYFDIKIFDEKEHIRYCGASNRTILSNFRLLHERAAAAGTALLPRIPLIPGITDREANIDAIARFLKDMGIGRGDILSYNPLWFEKCAKIGEDSSLQGDPQYRTWISSERLKKAKDIFAKYGISTA